MTVGFRRFINLLLLVTIACTTFSFPAHAQEPSTEVVQQLFLPLVRTKYEGRPVFTRYTVKNARSTDCTVVDPLPPANPQAADIKQQCLGDGDYLTIKSGSNLIFPAAVPQIGAATGTVTANVKQIVAAASGGYNPNDNSVVPQGDGKVYLIELNEQIPEVSAAVIGDQGALYVKALERFLKETLSDNVVFYIPVTYAVNNFQMTGTKTPWSCGMKDGTEVMVRPALWGHRLGDPWALKIADYLQVVTRENGQIIRQRVVTYNERRCMIPVLGEDAVINFRYLTYRQLRLEPSYAWIDKRVLDEMKNTLFYVPDIDFSGLMPELPSGYQWAITAQRAGEGALYFLLGAYAWSSGLFSTQQIMLIGPNACTPELAEFNMCVIKPLQEN
ncbi:hypothetical protein KAZ66_03080 [Candidatus Woesebacteria bacterium]|nr:hypothetical protein [Candidatus Woesebacteria bacterium]